MNADADPTAPDATTAEPAGTDSRPLLERLRARLTADGLGEDAAADAIGIPLFRLSSLLAGSTPNDFTRRRIEGWLRGEPISDTDVAVTAVTDAMSDASAVASVTPPDAGDAGHAALATADAPSAASGTPAPKRRGRPPKVRTPAELAAAATPKRRGRPPKSAATAATPPATPKRRGRPPKVRTEAELAAAKAADAMKVPKRRGRPPKVRSEAEQAAMATPKRRGRPPKPRDADAVAAPKRRGRPPKVAPARGPVADQPLLPRPRGRPPKHATGNHTNGTLSEALRSVFALVDDRLALAVHRADAATRRRIEAALRG